MNVKQDLIPTKSCKRFGDRADGQLVVAAHDAKEAMLVRAGIIKEAQRLANEMQDVSWRGIVPPEFLSIKPGPQVNVGISSHANHSNNINNKNTGGNQEVKV